MSDTKRSKSAVIGLIFIFGFFAACSAEKVETNSLENSSVNSGVQKAESVNKKPNTESANKISNTVVENKPAKTEKKESANELAGKYVYDDTTGIGGQYTLEFNSGSLGKLEILEEDARTKGSGAYKFDPYDRVLVITFGVELRIAGGEENEEPKRFSSSFHLEQVGKDFKVLKAEKYDHLVGKIFKRK